MGGLGKVELRGGGSGGGVPAPCCDCIPTQNRCAIETCPCLAARRICEEHCESARCLPFQRPPGDLRKGRVVVKGTGGTA